MSVRVHTHTHSHKRAHTHTRARARTRTHAPEREREGGEERENINIHKHMRARVRARKHTHVHTRSRLADSDAGARPRALVPPSRAKYGPGVCWQAGPRAWPEPLGGQAGPRARSCRGPPWPRGFAYPSHTMQCLSRSELRHAAPIRSCAHPSHGQSAADSKAATAPLCLSESRQRWCCAQCPSHDHVRSSGLLGPGLYQDYLASRGGS